MRSYLLSALAVAACVTCGSAGAIDLTVLPSGTTAQVGDTVPVDLVVSGLGNLAAPSLGAFDINLGFDGSVLNLLGVQFGTGLDVSALGSLRETTAGPGTVNLFEVSLDAPEDLDALQPGSFTLATLSFQVTAPGVSALTLTSNAFADALGDELPVNLVDSAITAVPEPGSALMLLLGLLPVALAARRRSAHGSAGV